MSLNELVIRFGNPLLSRETSTVSMALFASENREEVRIFYSHVSGQSFVLNPPKFLAIEAWKNPLVYFRAEMNGISNPQRLNPANLEVFANVA